MQKWLVDLMLTSFVVGTTWVWLLCRSSAFLQAAAFVCKIPADEIEFYTIALIANNFCTWHSRLIRARIVGLSASTSTCLPNPQRPQHANSQRQQTALIKFLARVNLHASRPSHSHRDARPDATGCARTRPSSVTYRITDWLQVTFHLYMYLPLILSADQCLHGFAVPHHLMQ